MSTELKKAKGPLGALALKQKLGVFLLQGLVISAFMHASVMTIVGLWPDKKVEQFSAGNASSDTLRIIPLRPENPVIPPRPITPPPKPDLPKVYDAVEEEPPVVETPPIEDEELPDFFGDIGGDVGDGDLDGVVGAPSDTPNAAGFNSEPDFSIFEIAPVPLDINPQPSYPALALRAGVEGNVWIWVHVGADGNVLGWQLTHVQPPDLGFEEEVAHVIPLWKFTPAIQQGNPVAVWVVLPFKFKFE
jgi:protein TonB